MNVFQKGSDVFWTSRSRWERHFLSPTYGVLQPLRILWCIRHKQFLTMLGYFIWMCFWFLYRNGSRSHSYIRPCSLSFCLSFYLSLFFSNFSFLFPNNYLSSFYSFLPYWEIFYEFFLWLHFAFFCYVDDYFFLRIPARYYCYVDYFLNESHLLTIACVFCSQYYCIISLFP